MQSIIEKKQKLYKLKTELEKNTALPLRNTATHLVIGEGNPDAALYFLGEAPGRLEDETGRPFVGLAGKLLDKLFEKTNIIREEVYISNIVRYRPPNNRRPRHSEIDAFAPSVILEIAIVNPKLLIPLGSSALHLFLPDAKISQIHGHLQTVVWQGRVLPIFPTYHPAAALRSKQVKKQLEEDFNKLPNVLQSI